MKSVCVMGVLLLKCNRYQVLKEGLIMAEKKDFMNELAHSLEEKKQGKESHMKGIDRFVPKKERPAVSSEMDEEIISRPYVPEEKPSKADEPVIAPFAPKEEKPPVFEVPEEDDDYDEPDSFGEEERIKVEKPKREIKPVAKIGIVALIALIAFGIYWFLFAPHITVPDFVGKDVAEVSIWAKQNKMDSGVVAMAPEKYSFEYERGVVMEQSVAPGKKVKKNTPITITVSAGADPDEKIDFPNLKEMTFEEINDWKEKNKLLKTKVTTQYSETVPNGHVISVDLKNVSESEFTRGSTLNVVCSKGPKPAETITVTDFVGKPYTEVETWAKSKKININKQEAFSDSVASGSVISQSKKSGEELKADEVLSVVVSKGKGVVIPNLVGYTAEQLEAWRANKNNTVTVVTKSVYNQALKGTVISQSLKSGSVVESGDVLELTISEYLPLIETTTDEWHGKNYLLLKAKVDEFNAKGANIQAGQYGEFKDAVDDPDVPKDCIIQIKCYGGTSDLADGCGRPLNLNSRISYQISSGVSYDKIHNPKPTPTPTPAPTPVPNENTPDGCKAAGKYWYDMSCHDEEPDNTTETGCKALGGYWHASTGECHDYPEPTPSTNP